MAVIADPTISSTSRSNERFTMADLLRDLGDIDPDRVHLRPAPGTATLEDAADWNENHFPPCEWIAGTLVEKPQMGQFEGAITFILLGELYQFLKANDLGLVYTPDVVLRILPTLGRAPDVSFVPWSALPDGKPPPREVRVPHVVPALAVEVLSSRNKPGERARKRREYFQAGVRVVWEIDPVTQSVRVYSGPEEFITRDRDATLDCAEILPGFTIPVATLFDPRLGHPAR